MQSAERLQRELEDQTHAITALREDMSRLQSEKAQELEETITRCAPALQCWRKHVRRVIAGIIWLQWSLQHHAGWRNHAVELLLPLRFGELEEALSMAEAHQQEAEDTARQLTELRDQLSALQEQVKLDRPFCGCERLCMSALRLLSSNLIPSLYLLGVLQVNAAGPWYRCKCLSQSYIPVQV